MNDKQVVLVTGANQGIGLQIAKDMLKNGYTVLIGSRNMERGLLAEKEVGTGSHAIQIDLTDESSIYAAAKRIRSEFGRLDVLINNAAIAQTKPDPSVTMDSHFKATLPSVVPIAEVRGVWETNVFGTLAVYQAMLPLLRETPNSRIVNVSSIMGSLTMMTDPKFPFGAYFDVVYAASKTALNALTFAMANELKDSGIKVNAVSPGFTNTAINGFNGTETVEQGAAEAVRVALLGADGPTGTFSHSTMGNIPW